MKKIILAFLLLGFAGAALAVDPSDLDARIRTLTSKFETFQYRPDKHIPADVLRKAQGVILLDRTKAGFLFAFQGGSGIALVRDKNDPTHEKWSPVAFLAANEASLGFQIGGEQNFFVILLMTTNATSMLIDSKFEIGSEARSTAGNAEQGTQNTTPPPEPAVLIYDDHKGLYAGADIKAGAIVPDNEANKVYYGQELNMVDILFAHKAQPPTDACSNLVSKINWNSHDHEHGKTAKE